MNAYIKTCQGFLKIYFIKSNDNCIVGQYIAPGVLAHHLGWPNQDSADVHFTYPKDGNVHMSLKLKDIDGTEHYHNAFTDKIKRKAINTSSNLHAVDEILRDIDEDMLSWSIKRELQRPLHLYASESCCYQFPTSCIPVNHGVIANGMYQPFISEEEFKLRSTGKDLVIAIEEGETCSVSVVGCVFGLPYHHLKADLPGFVSISEITRFFETRIIASKY